jgi:hypothetical protein
MVSLLATALAVAALQIGSSTVSAAEPDVDGNTGLIIAPGWELAAAHCGAKGAAQRVTAGAIAPNRRPFEIALQW